MADPISHPPTDIDSIRWLPYQSGQIKKKESEESLIIFQSQVTSSAVIVLQGIKLTSDLDSASTIVKHDLVIIKNDLDKKVIKKSKVEELAKNTSILGKIAFKKKLATLDFKIKLLQAEERHYEALEYEINRIESENQVKSSQFSLPETKPDHVNDHDWKILQGIPKSDFRSDNEAIKFSRRQHKLNYSYVLLKDGQLLQETHKSTHPQVATSTENPIGKGGFKVVSNLYGDSKSATYVRSVVNDIDNFDEAIFANQQARDLFKDSNNIATGIPHRYKSVKSGKDKLVYYSPKMTPLDQLIKNGALTDRKHQIKVINDLLVAVESIHNKGRAHRDIKADNILVKNGSAYLFDFDSLTSGKKQDNAIGTFTHQPPRFWKNNILKPQESKQCDLYAIGVTTLQIVSPDLFKNFKASLRKMLPPDNFGLTPLTDKENLQFQQNILEGQQEIKDLIQQMKQSKDPYLQFAAKIIGEEPGFESISLMKAQFDLIR